MDYYNEFLQSNITQWYLLNTKYQSVTGVACARKILGNYGRFPAPPGRPQSASKYSHRRDYFTRRIRFLLKGCVT